MSSAANALGGAGLLLLVATGVSTDPGHAAPYIAIVVGGVMLVQGVFSAGYALDWWKAWRETASGALLAGQLISGCVSLVTLWYSINVVPRAENGGIEPAPFFSGAAIGINALLALTLLAAEGAFTPKRGRGAA